MTDFFGNDFLLGSETAKRLYHEYAAKLPIIDYHCHIDARQILDNKPFADLSGIWLRGDHYKWRLMRACGVSEELITGNACGFDKFKAFAEIMPLAAGNPVYHWAHMELQRFFDCALPLCAGTASEIWELTSRKLRSDSTLTPQGILRRMNVEAIITTDHTADSLSAHRDLARSTEITAKVLPGFRPDHILNIETEGYSCLIKTLGEVSGIGITTYDDLKTALLQRIEHFDEHGCRAADHGALQLIYAPAAETEINEIFKKGLKDETVNGTEADKFKFALLCYLSGEYAKRDWVMELHLGVLRDVNTLMSGKLGADTGFDSIGSSTDFSQLAKVLDVINSSGSLPRTIIFPANPNDNAAVNTLAACFCGDGVKGRVQQGSAWWFNDTAGGIREQLRCFAEYGMLGTFIGMLTDSRSFMSYPRHEYFRRILCGMLGDMAEKGLYTSDIKYLSKIIQDVSYNNVKEYFRL